PRPLAKAAGHIGDLVASATGRDLPITAARIEKFCTSTNYRPARLHAAGFRQPVFSGDALKATLEWYLAQRSRDTATI
ncbi:MAG TPA: hypothetical protein VHL78_09780, partial [Actinomycetota bacterium]|nr:hypothetical protein [Actinomycetota bacterium]